MSLINQMLKDLDARHEADARGRLHREVRPLPPVVERNRGLRLAVLLAALAALAAAIVWAYPYLAVPSTPPAPSAAAPVPAAGEKPAAATGSAEVAAAPAVPTAVAAAAPPPADEAGATVAATESTGLKLSVVLDRLPEAAPEVANAPNRAPAAAKNTAAAAAATTATTAARPGTSAKAAAAPPSPVLAPKMATGVEKQTVSRGARDQSEADYRRALALVNAARVEEAADALLEVLRRDGGHAASRQLLVRLLIERRRFDEASALLAEGLALQPGQVGWAMSLARLRVEAGDPAAAARVLQDAQPYAEGNAGFFGFAGHVQHRLGHYRNAAELYQTATRLAASEGRWWLGLALALEAAERPQEAREAFQRARASGSLNPDLAALVEQKLR